MHSGGAETSPASPARRRLIWAGLTAVLAVVTIVGGKALLDQSPDLTTQIGGASPAPQVYGEVPAFSLIERDGRTVTADALRGQPWIADFIFTRCGGVCPVLSGTMGRLQSRLDAAGVAARLVSFSVDPAHDTPAVLAEYAIRHHADPTRWLFLTGSWPALHELIGEGFQLAVAQREAPGITDPNELITHSDRLVLIDGAMQIRGYYRGTEADVVDEIMADLGKLAPGP